MKKLAAVTALMFAAITGLATQETQAANTNCGNIYANAGINSAMREYGGIQIPDKVCKLLKDNKLALDFTGDVSVIQGVSVGWSSLRVMDRNTGYHSTYSMSQTYVDKKLVSMNRAQELVYFSIEDLVKDFDFRRAVKEVGEMRSGKFGG
ncbi:hypothetical protein [Herbaspirillum robiniae]|uniref:Uncharacterized protein n=1 Tax=Herbaspirillum robiniae TaxID=2014887 RepID=A0A246WS23_9BURK|nr:hypothetical protein [Herbaspirillum robiniae]NUU01972.1 hypothetical protein [Herbaspirillum robiniae]OWY28902.1 hypothetical protein CEJ42_13125 [Herbaspirillum robiniae]